LNPPGVRGRGDRDGRQRNRILDSDSIPIESRRRVERWRGRFRGGSIPGEGSTCFAERVSEPDRLMAGVLYGAGESSSGK
jgi:hypothetical protein